MLGWVRLTHPFPSILDGLVVGAVALVAGSDAGTAGRLAASMTLLQLGIGTANDVIDAPFDAGRKPGKPIPAGLVRPGPARGLVIVAFVGGVALAATVSLAVVALALAVVAIGLSYDLRLKGTAWSWVPFAVGIPILPVFGWLGARGGLPPAFAILVPAAVAAGAALAIGNSLVDVERDREAGRTSAAAGLGRETAGRLAVALFGGVALAAAISVAGLGGAPIGVLATVAVGAIPVAAAASVTGSASAAAREVAWRIEAAGTGLLAIVWMAQTLR